MWLHTVMTISDFCVLSYSASALLFYLIFAFSLLCSVYDSIEKSITNVCYIKVRSYVKYRSLILFFSACSRNRGGVQTGPLGAPSGSNSRGGRPDSVDMCRGPLPPQMGQNSHHTAEGDALQARPQEPGNHQSGEAPHRQRYLQELLSDVQQYDGRSPEEDRTNEHHAQHKSQHRRDGTPREQELGQAGTEPAAG